MKHIQRIGPIAKNKPFIVEGLGTGIVSFGQIPGQPDLYAWVVEQLDQDLGTPKRAAYLLVLTGDSFESHWYPVRSFIDSDGFEWHLLRYYSEDEKSIY